MSLRANGAPAQKDCYQPILSEDGRYVLFFGYDDLFAGSPLLIFHSDTYLRDRLTGTLELISVNSSEVTGNDYNYASSMSSDVRFVAFASFSTNLVPGDTNGPYPDGIDVFVRDRLNGTTERVSLDSSGVQGNASSFGGSLSADGRYIAFGSDASNLVAGDTNASTDCFLRDRQAGTTVLVSVDSSGVQGNGTSNIPRLTPDVRYAVFFSQATNLVPGDTNAKADVFVRDLQTGSTERVSLHSNGSEGDGDSISTAISADGNLVLFVSDATDLVDGDTNGERDVFVHDRSSGTTERLSVDSSGVEAAGASNGASMSPDGRYVVFYSTATNLVAGDLNGEPDVFLRDRQSGTTEIVSLTTNGEQGTEDSGIYAPAVSADGRIVAFTSRASLVEADTNGAFDIYARDRAYVPLASVCSPGLSGTIACPCSNPPAAAGRGCDNSSGTGGAILSASGIAYLTQESLVFTTSGEQPTSTSILFQGSTSPASGFVYGQGVRCVATNLKRMYTKNAVGGSIAAPDLGAGDPAVSARSAALGDVIAAGQSRWYMVVYRDPVVLGGCPAGSTFNATQAGQVTWLP